MLGAMWVVAQHAHPHLHRLVDKGRSSKAIVARIAEFGVVGSTLEFVPCAGLKRSRSFPEFVTGIALEFRHRLVNTLMLHHFRMTTRRSAGRHWHWRCLAGRFSSRHTCDKAHSHKTTGRHAHDLYYAKHAEPKTCYSIRLESVD